MRRLTEEHGGFEMSRKGRDPLYWARGRLVALRPDGASRTFDPEAIRVIRTPEEHDEFARTLDELYLEARSRADRGLPPAWLDPSADFAVSSNGHSNGNSNGHEHVSAFETSENADDAG